jgi:tRNA1(Val) A37 N6-methylase TrmN6
MSISKRAFASYIKSFQFRELFNDMGWNNDRAKQPIIVDENTYNLIGVAEKSGFRVFLCAPDNGKKLPDKATRKKIEGRVTKLFQEHLLIFIDDEKREQIWQLAVRKAGAPTRLSETRYAVNQDPELLYQRASGLFFKLDEEEQITIVDVTKRVAENFQQNNEKVTKKFYEGFKKEHTAFLKFINGIDSRVSMEWYASLMLNRLMFCYFIQKKGFLDNNRNYLQDKLATCKTKKGKNKFYSFYRDFLLALFHEGLGAPIKSKELEVDIGRVPYLNGGLFDEHEIEKAFKNIEIDDKAFERLFDFFDEYEWHLDTREAASGRDINPDVIGYIFEKYINDRAQMGAYYTKEDITDYISKNCIIPWLFDEVKRNYPKAFKDDEWLWKMVRESGDDYIYDAVKYGVPEDKNIFADLPDEIKKGFDPELEKKVVDGDGPYLHELRKDWNKPAPSDIALPTEIYREVIERRKRYEDIKTKIKNGEIKNINDFITYNLNIRQFAQDVIETTEDAEFIKHFYKALSGVTILDPTCGSGAFLFAALNILEPLYEAAIERMQDFVAASDKGKYIFFEKSLVYITAPEHLNLQYFIYKSIILNNLYGVDIMNEAVEIAKLRLFLKLVATVDADYRKPNLGLEPLPDVDFNIRAGNTLVGYATQKQIEEYAKDDLNDRLGKLRNELNILLHKKDYDSKDYSYNQWLGTHQPFHWFAEFYEIIQGQGGFDVIIGNPPYLELTQIDYKLYGYKTADSKAVHVFCIERSITLLNSKGNISMIVPLAIVSTQRMVGIQCLLEDSHSVWYSNYAWRPGKLFDTVNRALTIFCANTDNILKVFSTNYQKWVSDTRDILMDRISYSSIYKKRKSFWVPKLGQQIEETLLLKLLKYKRLEYNITKHGIPVYYRTTGGLYWKIFTNFPPYFKLNGIVSSSSRETNFKVESDIFWYWYTITSNLRDLNPTDIQKFTIPENLFLCDKLLYLADKYLEDIQKNSIPLIREQKNKGTTETQSFIINKSKPIIDEIDTILAQHYCFTHEELDFIINYDIKYRMGKELGGEEEE